MGVFEAITLQTQAIEAVISPADIDISALRDTTLLDFVAQGRVIVARTVRKI